MLRTILGYLYPLNHVPIYIHLTCTNIMANEACAMTMKYFDQRSDMISLKIKLHVV